MAKMSASFFRRMTLGMAMVSGVMLALEDEELTREEIIMLLNQLFQGLGADVDFKGLMIEQREDGGLAIVIPPAVMEKLEIKL